MLVAGADPLCDDNIAFAEALQASSKNSAVLAIYQNMPHSFHCHMELAPEQAMADFLLQ